MLLYRPLLGAAALVAGAHQAGAQTPTPSAAGACPTVLKPSRYPAPVVGSGYTAQLIVTNLTWPRGIVLDNDGSLLVLESGVGITRVRFDDRGGTCLVMRESSTMVADESV